MKRTSIGILLVVVLAAAFLSLTSAPASAQQTGTNWVGQYFNDTALAAPVGSPEPYPNGIRVNWGGGPPLKADNATPVAGIGTDNFSARFTSTQVIAAAGTYTFTIYVDDGVRVILNGTNVLDQFNQNTTANYRTFTFQQTFSANQTVNMVVEYVEFTGSALLVFQWGLSGGGGISPTAGPTPTPVPAATGMIHTVRGNALRTGPYLGASMIGVVRPNIAFPILEQNFDEGLFPWYKIQDNHGRVGWVSGRYLNVTGDLSKIPTTRTIFDEIDNPTDLPRLLDVTGYTRSTMNFRRRPSQRTDLLGQIPWGDAVQVIGRTVQGGQNFWLQVRYKDVVGWIYAPFVKLEGVVDAVPIR
jgi:hypothetical protein